MIFKGKTRVSADLILLTLSFYLQTTSKVRCQLLTAKSIILVTRLGALGKAANTFGFVCFIVSQIFGVKVLVEL